MRFLLPLCLLSTVALAADPPLTPEEQATFEGPRCKPFTDLFKQAAEEATKKAGGKPSPEQVGEALLAGKSGSGLSEEDFQLCNRLMIRAMKQFKARSIESEARSMLKVVAKSCARNFEEEKKLCPGTKAPAPADLSLIKKGDYVMSPADWEDPAWQCVYWSGVEGRQRFQYELKANPKKKTFEVIARGYPGGDDELVTLFITGDLSVKPAKISDLQRR